MKIPRLLFHPNWTRTFVASSAFLNLSGFFTAIGGATGALSGVFSGHAEFVGGACILLGIVCSQFAGWGRSTVKAVDNGPQP